MVVLNPACLNLTLTHVHPSGTSAYSVHEIYKRCVTCTYQELCVLLLWVTSTCCSNMKYTYIKRASTIIMSLTSILHGANQLSHQEILFILVDSCMATKTLKTHISQSTGGRGDHEVARGGRPSTKQLQVFNWFDHASYAPQLRDLHRNPHSHAVQLVHRRW